MSRYSRQEMIEGWNQSLLLKSSVGIIGAGALGNQVGIDCALLGVGSIHLYDFDSVELSNLNRQIFYTDRDIGRKKVYVLERELQKRNPKIKVIGHDLKIDEN